MWLAWRPFFSRVKPWWASHRYLFSCSFFTLFGWGWKLRICTLPVVPILLLSWIITLPLQTYTIFSRKKQENSTIFHPKYIVFLFINIKINWSEYVFILLEYRKIFSCRDFDVLLEMYCCVFKWINCKIVFAATERIFWAGNSRNGMLRKIAFEILNKKSGYGQYVIRIFLFCLLKMCFNYHCICFIVFIYMHTKK